jgi:virulence factor Mce-like protein
MQKQAPTFGRLMTMVLFALSCFGLLLFLWTSFGGPTPLAARGYRVHVAFPEATQLGLEADVRVAGVTVGRVAKKDIDPKGHPNRTVATLELEPEFAPLASDARAILRQKTLLGETYVELTPGTKAAPRIREDGWLADGRVAPSTELDEILQAFDPRTRQALRTWQQSLAGAARGRGVDLNDALGNLPAFAQSGDDLLAVLDDQRGAVQGLVRDTGTVFGALTQDEGKLRDLITGSDATFSQTARRQQALADTFAVFPTFLEESRTTFAALERFSQTTDPLVRELQPALHDLTPTLRDVRALAPDLELAYRRLGPLIDASKTGLPALRDTVNAATPLLGRLQPFLENLNPILEWLEYNQRTTADFISNGAAALVDTIPTRTSDEIGHYLRQFGPKGVSTLAITTNRSSLSPRGNAYPGPTALAGPERARKMIFPSFDCDEAGGPRTTKVPDTSDAPSCWIQPPPAYPPGNTRSFPHIEAADYSAAVRRGGR